MRSSLAVFVLMLACFGLASVYRARTSERRAEAEIAVAWSASRTDAKFFAGLQADYQRLDADVASVVTDDRPGRDSQGRDVPGLRTRLISVVGSSLREIERAREEYLDAKRVEHGLAPGTPLLYDGISWTTTSTGSKEPSDGR